MEPVLDAGRKIVHDADGRQETRKIIRESIPIHGKPKAIQERKKLFRLLPDFLSFLRSEPRSGGTFYANSGICQDTSKKLVRSLFIPEEPQQGLCPYASLPQDIFLT